MNFKNKTALITGASSGIGKATAIRLAGLGSNLILVARRKELLQSVAESIRISHEVRVHILIADLSIENSAKRLYNSVASLGESVDILVNNAGFGKWGTFTASDLAEYQKMIHLNVTTPTELSYLFFEELKAKPESVILNVGSTASFLPVPYAAVYGATKAYLLSLSEALNGECQGTNLHICCICPAGTDTGFNKIANDLTKINLEGLQKPEEIASAAIEMIERGKHYAVTGRKASLLMSRFLSREKVIKLVAKSWLKRISN